jgi:hypothetical protein
MVESSEKLVKVLGVELTKVREERLPLTDMKNKGFYRCIELVSCQVSKRSSDKPLVVVDGYVKYQ